MRKMTASNHHPARWLLIATHNPDKVREFREIFAHLPLELASLDDAQVRFEVDETGQTMRENAVLKAEQYCEATGLLTLADDSGLEIDALGGEPGVLSSRFAGPDAGAEERNRLILERMRGLPPAQRSARYRCVIAVAGPGVPVQTVEATCEGQIALEPRGNGGFGYDPIFFLPPLAETMAEVPASLKNLVSHRGKAARAAEQLLRTLLETPEG